MEGWKNLAIRQFDNSAMEDWKIGKMDDWKNLAIWQFDNSTMEDWKIGKMEDWKNLAIWQFGNSIIRQWKNGRLIKSCRLPTSSSRQTPYAKRFFFTAYWVMTTHTLCLTPYATRLTTANCQLATADFPLHFAK